MPVISCAEPRRAGIVRKNSKMNRKPFPGNLIFFKAKKNEQTGGEDARQEFVNNLA